jgi:hypothetical protein
MQIAPPTDPVVVVVEDNEADGYDTSRVTE